MPSGCLLFKWRVISRPTEKALEQTAVSYFGGVCFGAVRLLAALSCNVIPGGLSIHDKQRIEGTEGPGT